MSQNQRSLTRHLQQLGKRNKLRTEECCLLQMRIHVCEADGIMVYIFDLGQSCGIR